MSATYSASRSHRIALKPFCRAAWPVVPLPANGSRTTPPGGVIRRANQDIKETGLMVGCLEPARSALLALLE